VQFCIAIICFVFSLGCNLSDDTKRLPGGHTYVNEGHCYKYILVNIKDGPNIESCVLEFKYDDNYITVAQIDEIKCEQSTPINTKDKKFFIIDTKKEKLLGPFTHLDFKVKFGELHISEILSLE